MDFWALKAGHLIVLPTFVELELHQVNVVEDVEALLPKHMNTNMVNNIQTNMNCPVSVYREEYRKVNTRRGKDQYNDEANHYDVTAKTI